MADLTTTIRHWVVFAGFVLVVAVLYWAQAILVPLAVAVLLTFLLTPPLAWLQARIGRVSGIVTVVVLVFTLLGAAAWGVGRQLSGLADDLPGYRQNIRAKIADVRGASRGGSVEKVQETLEEIKTEMEKEARPAGTPARPVVVQSGQVASLWGFPAWVGPLIEPISTAGLVIILVIFMLIERQELRDRLIGVVGHGHLTVTTRAFEEAGTRVSRYLLMQTIVNLTYGVGVAAGLYLIGVPHWLLWAALGSVLRFIPYVGPLLAAAAPILISLAAIPGWTKPISVIGLFVALELFTNLVLETLLYAGAAGVSQVALLVAVAFWTWLWGPMGLLLATPLTVCLVVLGKHVPGLEFLATLMADVPALTADMGFYQRLLARDQTEAAEIVERYVETEPPPTVFDALLLPALNYAERDRFEDRLSPDEEAAVVTAVGELIADAASVVRAASPEDDVEAPPAGGVSPVRVLACAANSQADVFALRMLEVLMEGSGATFEITSPQMLASEIIETVSAQGYRIVCVADLPPSAPSKTRYLLRKLRAGMPGVKLVVGRWAPPALADESPAPLLEAGADHVGARLLETRDHLRQVVQQALLAGPEPMAAAS